MPYLQFKDQRVALTQADQAVGAFDGAALRVPGDDPAARAIIRLGADGTGIIARGHHDAVVQVNGVRLGQEPAPLLHGDKVELGGQQLHYGEDAKGGSTQFISAASLAEQVKVAVGAPKKPTSATGGRLVSLVDGREYTVSDAGVTFGREIGNDIVVATGEVSRRHAQIVPGESGYILNDLSTNGVLINGARVSERQLLGRGDVINIGGEEFRFYADKAKEPAASAPPPAPAPVAAPAPAAATPPVPARKPIPVSTDETLQPASRPPAMPIPEAPTEPKPVRETAGRAPLATLEIINEGPIKGTRFEIFTPLTNIGRGAHNDVAIADDSVSDSHAKILRKDGHWYVVDQGSTNGTYVGGRRVQGEQQLVGAPDVRFGNIKLTFRPSAGSQDEGGSTRAIAALSVDKARRMAAPPTPPTPPTPPAVAAPSHKSDKPIVIPETPVPDKKGCAAMIAFVIALGAAGAGMLAILLTVGG
jgi:pSer/pThr/pTyr-binding forkhead associated (FHA) protein